MPTTDRRCGAETIAHMDSFMLLLEDIYQEASDDILSFAYLAGIPQKEALSDEVVEALGVIESNVSIVREHINRLKKEAGVQRCARCVHQNFRAHLNPVIAEDKLLFLCKRCLRKAKKGK